MLKRSIIKLPICVFLGISQMVFSASESYAEAAYSIPKGLQDIVQLINETPVDLKFREEGLNLLKSSPPANLSKDNLALFYYKQSVIAGSLGRINLRIEKLKQTIDNISIDNLRTLIHVSDELADAEANAGENIASISRKKELLQKVHFRTNGGISQIIESALVKVYSEAGDFENAEKHLRSLSAGYTNVFRFLSDLNKKNWNRSYYIAVGELAYHQGKFVEAEIAFSKGLEAYESGFEENIKRFDNDKLPQTDNGTHPFTQKARHDEIYRRLSDIKLRLRKVNEAEFFAREALKKSLKYFGRSSISTSESMRQLAIVLLSHERNKDAIYLLNQALLGLNDAGVSAEAINLARTKKTLASAFIADERYADSLTIYAELDRTIATYPDTARFIDTNSLDRVLALVRVGSLSEAEARAKQLLAATEARAGKKSKEATDAKLMLAMTLAEEKKDGEARSLFSTGMAELVEFEREAGQDSDGASSKEKKYLAGYIESYLGLLARLYEKKPILKS